MDGEYIRMDVNGLTEHWIIKRDMSSESRMDLWHTVYLDRLTLNGVPHLFPQYLQDWHARNDQRSN